MTTFRSTIIIIQLDYKIIIWKVTLTTANIQTISFLLMVILTFQPHPMTGIYKLLHPTYYMQKMQRNIGQRNRFERGVLGLALLLLGFFSTNWLVFTVLLFISSVMIGEAFSGHCIYHHVRKTKDMR